MTRSLEMQNEAWHLQNYTFENFVPDTRLEFPILRPN